MTADLLVVANAQAGTADEDTIATACDVLGGGTEVVRTADVAELDRALDRLDGRALVVVGGDGSLHLAVQRLWNRGADVLAGVPIGLVPLGTGNDFARGVDWPLDAADAARRVLTGGMRAIDLLVTDDGSVVVNASHAGIGASAAERADGLKANLGPAAYPLGALLAGVTEGGADLRVTVDGQVVSDGSTLMVGIANGPFIGGGTPLAPSAVPDDGLLDVVVVTAVGPLARAAFAAALRKGEHVDRDDVAVHRGTEVSFAGDPVPHDLDGEVVPDGPSRYRLVPAAWSLLGG